MYWDKRGILKIYNFCRRGRRHSPHFVRHLSKGVFSWVEENTPFGIPRDNEGTPLAPALSVPARNHCTRCAKNCLRFPVAAFDLVCAYVRSAAAAAGFRRRFIPSLLGKPARLYKIRSPAAASRRSTAHTAHRLSYPRHTFSFCTAQHNAHIQVPYTASTISHSAAEKICSPHSPCTFLRFSISVIVTITLRLWKVNLSFVKMFASC